MKWFRGRHVLKDHRLVYHSTPGWRVTKRKKRGKHLGGPLWGCNPVQDGRSDFASHSMTGVTLQVNVVILHGQKNQHEQLLRRSVKRFRIFKVQRLVYHSTLGSGVIKKKREKHIGCPLSSEYGTYKTVTA